MGTGKWATVSSFYITFIFEYIAITKGVIVAVVYVLQTVHLTACVTSRAYWRVQETMWCVTWRQDGVNVTKVLLNTRETVLKVHTNDLLRTICIKRQTKKMLLMKWNYSYSVQRQITQIVIIVVSIILLFSILFLLLRFMIGSNNSSCMGDWIWGQVHEPKLGTSSIRLQADLYHVNCQENFKNTCHQRLYTRYVHKKIGCTNNNWNKKHLDCETYFFMFCEVVITGQEVSPIVTRVICRWRFPRSLWRDCRLRR